MMKRRLKLVLLCVWVLAVALFAAMKFYAVHRPIKIYVARLAPMPAELADGLHMKEHGINPVVTIESRYENSENKILSLDEIDRMRSQIIWYSIVPPFFDSLTIQSSNRVLVRRTTRSVMQEYQLVKSGDRWSVESSTRRTLNPTTANN
jgi:hypothetical protein